MVPAPCNLVQAAFYWLPRMLQEGVVLTLLVGTAVATIKIVYELGCWVSDL